MLHPGPLKRTWINTMVMKKDHRTSTEANWNEATGGLNYGGGLQKSLNEPLCPTAEKLNNLQSLRVQLTQKAHDPAEEGVEVAAVGGHDGLLLGSLRLHQEARHLPNQNLGRGGNITHVRLGVRRRTRAGNDGSVLHRCIFAWTTV